MTKFVADKIFMRDIYVKFSNNSKNYGTCWTLKIFIKYTKISLYRLKISLKKQKIHGHIKENFKPIDMRI